MNELQSSLKKCRVEGNTVFLPPISEGVLKNYNEVRKALLNAGAEYKKNSFIFKSSAQPFIDRLTSGENVNIKKEFQAFFTPKDVAEWLVQHLFITEDDTILEPNGGEGALIKAIRSEGHKNHVYTYELNPIFSDILSSIKDVTLLGSDFLKADKSLHGTFNKIIANPPFNKNQDIEHIYKMWDMLAKKGRIVTVASKHWQFANDKKCKQFKEWMEENEAEIYPLDKGAFKSSGTNVESCILIIDKA